MKLALCHSTIDVSGREGEHQALPQCVNHHWLTPPGPSPHGPWAVPPQNQVVQEKLCKYVLDRVNVHNVLLHLARRRRLTLESLQQELVAVQGQAVASKEAQAQLQVLDRTGGRGEGGMTTYERNPSPAPGPQQLVPWPIPR